MNNCLIIFKFYYREYIQSCANITSKIPIFGSGDVFSYRDYENIMNDENNKVSGVMIGRGALIKPWIFTGK